VYFETLFVCSITAFIILLGDPTVGEGVSGASMTQTALASQVGDWGIHFVTIILFFLAFSSVIGNYYLAQANIEYFSQNKSVLLGFRIIVLLFVLGGSVGSIGVLLSNYGVQDTLKMLGIERRTQTAGKNKAFMDPTAPMSAEQKAHAQAMLDEVHRQFIDVVKQGRGQRLKETPETFSGLFWTGERSIQLGLADGLGAVGSVARDVLNTENVVDFSEYSRWQMLARQFGAEAFGGFWKQVQTRVGGQEPVLR